MIKNYIFDFGNVLAHYNPADLTAVHISEPETAKTVTEAVFDRLYWDRLDNGSLDDDEAKAEFCKRLPRELHRAAELVYDKWIVSMPPVSGMQALVADIKANGGHLYLLSNISRGFSRNYTNSPWIAELLSEFDGLVLSGTVGMVKPNRDIFEYLLDKYSLDPNECIFIDDAERNIAAARELGIDGYLFDGDSEKLRKYLQI